MSDRNGSSPKLDLKLNLSPPRIVNRRLESPIRPAVLPPTSPPSSCVSIEVNQADNSNNNNNNNPEYSNNPSLVLVGCLHCLMYVMVCENDLKCPKCKSTDLVDFHHDSNNNPTIRWG